MESITDTVKQKMVAQFQLKILSNHICPILGKWPRQKKLSLIFSPKLHFLYVVHFHNHRLICGCSNVSPTTKKLVRIMPFYSDLKQLFEYVTHQKLSNINILKSPCKKFRYFLPGIGINRHLTKRINLLPLVEVLENRQELLICKQQ